MNLGIPNLIDKYKDLPFDGIGLMRIEFVIASNIGVHPLFLVEKGKEQIYIDELSISIKKVCQEIYPKPVVVRFSDLKTSEYRNLKGGENYENEEKNPMMGWRGASRYISDKYNAIFRLECRAIKNVRKDCKNAWVMIPFVRTVWEAKKCLDILFSEGLKKDDNFKIWIMAETPAIALLIKDFNKLPFDGYSIGSNDLCQFILAVDRDSTTLAEMGYFDERDPAVMRAMETITKGAKRGGKTCSICGESVSNYPEVVKRLFDLNIDSISVNPDKVVDTRKFLENIVTKQVM